MSKVINTAAIKKITLNESDTEKSVMQNIAIIIRTRMGTVPLYREFGLYHECVDKPMTVAAPEIIADLREAIEVAM
jgi:phage baseplate assembly protein W